MTYQSHTNASGTGDWLIGAVKKNPEGLLLLAAGCALLLRHSGGWSARSGQSTTRDSRSSGYEHQGGARQNETGVSDSISRAADSAREYVSDVGKTVGEKASNYAAAVSDYAGEAGRTVVDQSERLAKQTQTTIQDTINRVLKEQPLAIAVLGLAAGAAVAAVLPSTDAERRTLGPAGEKLSEAAATVGENLSEAASKAGERLVDAAEERGINSKGLKEVATDVAGVFGSTLRGEQPDRGSSGSRESSSGQGASRGFEPGGSQFGKPNSPAGSEHQDRASQSSGGSSSAPGQSGQSRGYEPGGSQLGKPTKPGGSGL
jgi:hypothetical protein